MHGGNKPKYIWAPTVYGALGAAMAACLVDFITEIPYGNAWDPFLILVILALITTFLASNKIVK